MTPRPIIEARQLTKSYTIDDRRIQVLDDVSLSIRAGEFAVIQGSSGSGKSTLLSLLSGLDRPDSGTVRIQSQDITTLNEDDLAPLRNRTFGFVFQSFHLVPSLSAHENVMFPAELNHNPKAADEANKLLERVGLGMRSRNMPHQLSGGEQQRVAICRALINRPAIIFADEPTGNLDSRSGQAILELLLEFQREYDTTLLMVTHNPAIAQQADSRFQLADGLLTPPMAN
ncbi:MAG: ABC transporter ATP-binding protein [Desulfobacterales bacterium]|nr:ABC transporter ATP-binding protein [Desulfobacterales bacterium]